MICVMCLYVVCVCMFIDENSSYTPAMLSVWSSEDTVRGWSLPSILLEVGSLACHHICQMAGL